MKNEKYKVDNFIKDLILKSDIEHPSDDFTKKIMDKIYLELQNKPVNDYRTVFNKKLWVFVSASFIIMALVFLVFYNWSFINTKLEIINIFQFKQLFINTKVIFFNIINIFNTLLHSPLITSIITSFLFFGVLDKMFIKKLHSLDNTTPSTN